MNGKEKVGTRESFGLTVHRKDGNPEKQFETPLTIMGHTVIKKNGILVIDRKNTIATDLKDYLAGSMSSVVDEAINNLFNDDEVATGGAQDGRDGIEFEDTGATTNLSAVTTSITATQTYGKRWKGVLNATSNHAVDKAVLGYNYGGGSPFATPYATQTFSTVNLVNGDVLEAEWEIYIV